MFLQKIVQACLKVMGIIVLLMSIYFGSIPTALAQGNGQVPHVRKEAHSAAAQNDLVSLNVAMGKMRALDCSNPLGWYYQGAIHWLPNSSAELSGLAQNPLCPSYTQAMPKLKEAWTNCTHDSGSISEIHFLSWHRLFVYHFEKVVRYLSGNPDFSLPYWGYVNLDTTEVSSPKIFLTMPPAFIQPADVKSNSLYETARNKVLLAGKEIEAGFAEENLVKAVQDLNKPIPFAAFNQQMDAAPHGAMHDYIGTGEGFNQIYNRTYSGLMANVPSAGFDPIFWMHHGNIDRLWEQWNQSPNGEKVTLDQLKSVQWPYVFFDPDPSSVTGWKKVTYTPEQVIEMIYNLDYVYDSQPPVIVANAVEPRGAKPVVRRSQSQLSSLNTNTVVSNDPVNVKLTLSSEKPVNLPLLRSNQKLLNSRTLESTPESAPALKGYALEVTVSYTGKPSGFYKVYLNPPSANTASDIKPYFAGSMVFFVLDSDQPVTKTFRFDITDELLSQLERDRNSVNPDSLSLSIIKNGGKADENIMVKKVSLYSY